MSWKVIALVSSMAALALGAPIVPAPFSHPFTGIIGFGHGPVVHPNQTVVHIPRVKGNLTKVGKPSRVDTWDFHLKLPSNLSLGELIAAARILVTGVPHVIPHHRHNNHTQVKRIGDFITAPILPLVPADDIMNVVSTAALPIPTDISGLPGLGGLGPVIPSIKMTPHYGDNSVHAGANSYTDASGTMDPKYTEDGHEITQWAPKTIAARFLVEPKVAVLVNTYPKLLNTLKASPNTVHDLSNQCQAGLHTMTMQDGSKRKMVEKICIRKVDAPAFAAPGSCSYRQLVMTSHHEFARIRCPYVKKDDPHATAEDKFWGSLGTQKVLSKE